MTNLQLALSIGIPSLLVLVGIFLNNARFNSIDARFSGVDARFSTIDNRFNSIDNRFTGIEARLDRMNSELNARLDRQQSDLSQFYEILGRHDADIATLKEDRRRSA